MDIKSPRFIFDPNDGVNRDFQDISLESLGAHVLFGDVNEQSMLDATTFVLKANQLFKSNREITIFVNTLGGNCYDGFAFIDIMDISKNPIRTVGLGNIVSMGVLILAAGHKGRRVITKNTQIMAHQFSDSTTGKFHEIMAAFNADIYLRQQFIEHFKRHSLMTEKEIQDVLFGSSDRWLTPVECKRYGLVDHIIGELPEFSFGYLTHEAAQSLSVGSKRRSRKQIADIDSRKKR